MCLWVICQAWPLTHTESWDTFMMGEYVFLLHPRMFPCTHSWEVSFISRATVWHQAVVGQRFSWKRCRRAFWNEGNVCLFSVAGVPTVPYLPKKLFIEDVLKRAKESINRNPDLFSSNGKTMFSTTFSMTVILSRRNIQQLHNSHLWATWWKTACFDLPSQSKNIIAIMM